MEDSDPYSGVGLEKGDLGMDRKEACKHPGALSPQEVGKATLYDT